MFIFGIGGGSDYYSSQLVKHIMKPLSSTIFTSLAAMYVDGVLNLDLTIEKYKSRSEFRISEIFNGWPLFIDCRAENAYGIVVPHRDDVESFNMLTTSFVQFFLPNGECPPCLAVDTGGDSLRGLVPGMGGHDIGHLFSNHVDDRDTVSLLLISVISQAPVCLYVLGPGSDGETRDNDLTNALISLYANACPRVCLVKEGRMDEFYEVIPQVTGWDEPTVGSTIWNIRNATGGPSGQSMITRRGVEIFHVSNAHLKSYWNVLVYPSYN